MRPVLASLLFLAACGDVATAPAPDAGSAPYCGDGVIDPGEGCELQPDDTWPAGCNACALCGDRLIGGYETCDDGNDVWGDGCSTCRAPGTAFDWYLDAGGVGAFAARPDHGMRMVGVDGERIVITDVDYRGVGDAQVSTAMVPASLDEPIAISRVVTTDDGGTIGCGHGPHTEDGTTVVVFAIDAAHALRWTHRVEGIALRRWFCAGIAMDEASDQVVVALINEKATLGGAGGDVAHLRRIGATGAAVGDDVILSSYYDGGVFGVLDARPVGLDVVDAGVVVLSAYAETGSFAAAVDGTGVQVWQTPASPGEVIASGARVAVVSTDGSAQILSTAGVVERTWPLGHEAWSVAVDHARSSFAVSGLASSGVRGLSRWTLDGELRYAVEQPGNAQTIHRAAGVGDDGITFVLHGVINDERGISAYAP